MRTHVFEDLRRAVAVGDETGDESGSAGCFEYFHRPFAGDEGFVVGADEDFCALAEGVANEVFR